MIYRTYKDWKSVGKSVKRGASHRGRNEYGEALFTSAQVENTRRVRKVVYYY